MTLVLSLPLLHSGCFAGALWNCVRRVAVAVLMVVLSVTAKAQATPSSTPQTTPPPAQEEKQEAKTQATPPSAPPATPPPEEKEKMIRGYITHQSIELGGHIVDQSGSSPMYSTLVNIQTGPRILSQSLTMRATDP